MTRARLLPVLLAVVLCAAPAARGGEAGGAEPGKDPEPNPNEQLPALKRMFEGLVLEDAPAGSSFRPRHPVDRRLRLRYEGHVRDRILAVTPKGAAEVTNSLYEMKRVGLIEPAGAELARARFYSEYRLVENVEAGRDRLEFARSRPSRGIRILALIRRLSGRGMEPTPGDQGVEQLLAPVPEFPRLPAAEVTAGRPVSRMSGSYLVTWALVGAGKLGERRCWMLACGVRPAALLPMGESGATGVAVHLVDAADSTVLGVVSQWRMPDPSEGTVRERIHEFRLAGSDRPEAEELAREAARIEAARELLAAVAEHSLAGAERALAAAERDGYDGPAVDRAERFIAAEKQLSAAAPGARRIELVPEDTFAFVSAPPRVDPDARLTPVVFFHGAAAEAETYFRDWKEQVGARPLLLVFPQSRGWTWSGRDDGAVTGSLMDVLGRTYPLDRGRLVLAGHAAGAELAFVLGYGASFPKTGVRGIAAADGLLDARLRDRAYTEKPPELVARLRAVDVFLLGGADNRQVRPESVRNLASWLRSYNPDGIRLEITPGVALRYDSKTWTPKILEWITGLPAARAGGGGDRAPR